MPFAYGEQNGSLFAGVGHSKGLLTGHTLNAASVPVVMNLSRAMNNQENTLSRSFFGHR